MGLLLRRKPKDNNKNYQIYLQDMSKSLIEDLCNDTPIKVYNANTKQEEIHYPKNNKECYNK